MGKKYEYDPSIHETMPPEDAGEQWVLKAMVASTKQGRPLYFAKMTAIGPMTTPRLSEAARFASPVEASRSPAFSFMLEIFEPVSSSAEPNEKQSGNT